MNRRAFITLLGGAAAWPLAARAQQSLRPLIAVLEGASAASMAERYDAFRAELRLLGYVEGRNCSFEYRYADGFLDRLFGSIAGYLNPRIVDLRFLVRLPEQKDAGQQ